MLLHLRKRVLTKGKLATFMMAINLPSSIPCLPFKILIRKPMVGTILITDVVFDPQANWYVQDMGCQSTDEAEFDKVCQDYIERGWKEPVKVETTTEEMKALIEKNESIVFPNASYFYKE